MIFPINEEWRIASDEHSWNVERLYIPKTGKNAGREIWQAKTYHMTFEQAVNAVYNERLRLIDAEGLVDTLKAIKALQHDVKSLSEQFRAAA